MAKLPKPTLPLGSEFGPYHLVKLIAVGGMAEIYLARTQGMAGFEKHLALKVIHPDYADDRRFVQMLVDEAKLAVKLTHANIAQTFDLGRIEDTYFISMEYVDGADCFRILKAVSELNQEMPIAAALYVVRETMAGLDYAHNKTDDEGTPLRIIHRDISPQNILLSRHGEVKIVDFGIAKAANVSSKTRAGVIKGKLVYMSPEQSWGDPVDQRTDVFSAGIVLYEALTGGSVYHEKNPVKLLELVRKVDVKPPSVLRPGISPDLDALVMKAIRPNPAERYQSGREFGAAISEYLRRTAPDFSAPQLGQLVETVLDNQAEEEEARGEAPARAGVMQREDFAVHRHSVVYSPEELAESSSALGRRRGGAAEEGRGGRALGPAQLLLIPEVGDPIPFNLGAEFVIGRGGDLRLADGRVSRRHARVVHEDGRYLLEDLQSSNGTFLNGDRIEGQRSLSPGDVIRIGPFEMRFERQAHGGRLSGPEPGAPPVPPFAPERLDRSERTDRPERLDRSERTDRPERLDRSERTDRPERLDRSERTDRPERANPAVTGPVPQPPAARSGAAPMPPIPPPAALASSKVARPPMVATPSAETQRLAAEGVVTLQFGAERMVLAVERSLPLGHTVSIGEAQVEAVGGTVVRRADGYWVELAPGYRPLAVNGRPIDGAVQLTPGDKLMLGPLELCFDVE